MISRLSHLAYVVLWYFLVLNFLLRVVLIITRIVLTILLNCTFGLKNYTSWYDLNKLPSNSRILKLKKGC
jgi:hypothetical protein